MNGGERVILYIPGIKPKPPADVHRENLLRCLQEGLRRTSPDVAAELAAAPECLRIAPWPHLFYPAPSDPRPDAPGIERLLRLPGPEPQDLEDARHWHKSVLRVGYLLTDAFPFLVDWIVDPRLKEAMHDSLIYLRNQGGVGSRVREFVRGALRDTWGEGRRMLVIAHSMGSVIAFDVLWQLSREQRSPLHVDTFMSLASPLGLNFMRHRLLGSHAIGAERYPANIRRWHNLAAVGDLIPLQRRMATDYREMLELGLVETIVDEVDLYNYFRGQHGLNVHKCYGYMVNSQVCEGIARWWRGEADPASGD
ncbi:MAG: hypothetical protein JSV45_10285 [Chromatiales bacterium]|nr:MAG: hypothetical protein JSV45_10285 [Chromatiales bacterium]